MINPVGSPALKPLFVYDPDTHHALMREAETLPSVMISSQAAANAVMLGGGYFSPLRGFMNVADAISVAQGMRTADGLFFPVPVINVVEDAAGIEPGMRIALKDPNVEGNPVLANQTVDKVETATDEQMAFMTDKIFRTDDMEHPGVKAFNTVGKTLISGPIEVLNYSYFATEFPDTFRTAMQIREAIEKNGWTKVVAFQTRNPMHRAHEELVRMAMDRENADGAVIHMLLGTLKPGDIPADVSDAAIRKMAELYVPPNSVDVTG